MLDLERVVKGRSEVAVRILVKSLEKIIGVGLCRSTVVLHRVDGEGLFECLHVNER